MRLREQGRSAWRPILAGVGAGVHWWIGDGAFVTSGASQEVRRVFVSSRWLELALAVLCASALLLLIHSFVRLRAAKASAVASSPLDPDEGAWATPLLMLWASALAPVAAVPGVARVFQPFAFVLVDLRSWWTAAIAAATLFGLWRRLRGPVAFEASVIERTTRRRLAPELTLVVLCGAWVVAGTPHLRFSSTVHGDEAKYLRYCENFYQGHGLEISRIRPIAELPRGFGPRYGRNLAQAARVLPKEVGSLVADAGVFLSDPFHRFARSVKTQGFLRGKDGGVYQVHQPGLSVLMLPAYSVDRHVSIPKANSRAQWPPRLKAVNAFFLGLYLSWVVLIYRLVARLMGTATGAVGIAWTTTLAVGASMPVAAFPFQFYPEVPAGILTTAVAGHVFFPRRRTAVAGFVAGIAIGCLPWLHVRFLALAAVLSASVLIAARRERSRLAGLVGGIAIPTAFLLLYVYRLTGSILPTSLWAGESGELPLSIFTAIPGSVAYLVDRRWGLLAHAPIYLLALPGCWLLARQRRDLAWFCALGFLAVLLPSAAHTLHAAATTPSRLIVAVVPLASLPLASVLARSSRLPWLRGVFAALALLSAQNALAYNWSHVKHVGWLVDRSFSGWKVNLLFPARSATPWVTASNGWLYVLWVLALIVALIAPFWLERRRAEQLDGQRRPRFAAVWTLAVVVLLGVLVGTLTGVRDEADYRKPDTAAVRRATTLLQAPGRRLIVCSDTGRIARDEALSVLVDANRPLRHDAQGLGRLPLPAREVGEVLRRAAPGDGLLAQRADR